MTNDAKNSITAWLSVTLCAVLFALTLYLLRGVDTHGWQSWTTGILCVALLVNVIRTMLARRSSKGERN